MDTKKPNIMEEEIPALVVTIMLEKIPSIPFVLYPSYAAKYNKFPKEVIGTEEPILENSINLSYIPKKASNAPITTNIDVICPGVSLVLSSII